MAIDAIISQVANEALNKAIAKSDEIAKPSEGASFKDMLTQMDSGMDYANMLGIEKQDTGPSSTQMASLGGDGVGFNPSLDDALAPKADAGQKVLDMLGEINKAQNQMDTIVNFALFSDKQFSSKELLALQASVFRSAQVMELAVKGFDHSVSSVKALYNTQV